MKKYNDRKTVIKKLLNVTDREFSDEELIGKLTDTFFLKQRLEYEYNPKIDIRN